MSSDDWYQGSYRFSGTTWHFSANTLRYSGPRFADASPLAPEGYDMNCVEVDESAREATCVNSKYRRGLDRWKIEKNTRRDNG